MLSATGDRQFPWPDAELPDLGQHGHPGVQRTSAAPADVRHPDAAWHEHQRLRDSVGAAGYSITAWRGSCARRSFERAELTSQINWPNRFSRFVGDKVFGLLVADAIGLAVPRTTAVSRKIAPFAFGLSTESCEWWTRTAPTEQVPGKFTTRRGWTDPFDLLRREDPGVPLPGVSRSGCHSSFGPGSVPGVRRAALPVFTSGVRTLAQRSGPTPDRAKDPAEIP
jgi:hypothetical protein